MEDWAADQPDWTRADHAARDEAYGNYPAREGGADVATIQKVSGQKTLATVLRYAHIDGEHVDEATEALSLTLADAITRELRTPAANVMPLR